MQWISEMLTQLFFIGFSLSFSNCYIIDYSTTKIVTINDTSSYFGYSVHLQKGNPPIAIVGAPKRKRNNKNTGSIFKCDLNRLSCSEYSRILNEEGRYIPGKNGDFLGSVVDGDDTAGGKFFTCAPRFVTAYDSANYFTNGRCFHIRDSRNLNENARLILPLKRFRQIDVYQLTLTAYYDSAFGESGMALIYSKDQSELLIGAPGKSLWNGALVKTTLNSYQSEVYNMQPDLINHHDNYFGYAVSSGKFMKNSAIVWYVSGAPRGFDLKGHVVFFEKDTRTVRGQLFGEEFGSYFGASLLVIHDNNNNGDDILVGAPMYSGQTWNEGCVYYYKNKNNGNFHSPVKILGKKPDSRFGTAISDMGDIDLDSFHDCAISAPYEDDGVGAVYLYFGTKDGFSNDRYHRISPSNFATLYPTTVVRGFGMGISKGNDVDANGHNDIVIGAYRSGHIFYFKSRSIIDINAEIRANVETIYTTSNNFSVTYCLMFSFRNKKKLFKSFQTQLLLLDGRISNVRRINETVRLQGDQLVCKNHTVFLTNNSLRIDPFTIRYKYKLDDEAFDEKTVTIPVSYACGTDNICQTDLSVKATIGNTTNLVIGLTDELEVFVTIDNSGESAYQTKLYVTVPPEVSLINLRECYFENGSYVCLVDQILTKKLEKKIILDLANLPPNRTNLLIHCKVESIGIDVNLRNNEVQLDIPVTLQNNPYIDSEAFPDRVVWNKTKQPLAITYVFGVGNQGPSPVDLNFIILVPQMEVNGTQIVEIKRVEGTSSGISRGCRYSNRTRLNLPSFDVQLPIPYNKFLLSCLKDQDNCVEIHCRGGYFSKSNENALFSLKLVVHVELLGEIIENEDLLVVSSTAYLNNGTNEIFASTLTYVYIPVEQSVLPFWIYVASVVVGFILLIIIILTLYKCNFFKRTYREKLLEKEQKDMPDDTKKEEVTESVF